GGVVRAAPARPLRERVRRVLDVEAPVQAVRLAHPAGRHEGQSTTSTSTRWPSRTAAAFMTVRRAATVRPPRPITLPASSSATWSSSTIVPSSSSKPSTLTSSGLSTSDRARYSSSSSTRWLALLGLRGFRCGLRVGDRLGLGDHCRGGGPAALRVRLDELLDAA